MAKKKTAGRSIGSKSVNKSQAVRDFYATHPDAKPKDVVRGLAKKGIELNAQYVSVVRSNSKKKSSLTAGKVGRPTGCKASRAATGDSVSLDALLKFQEVVEEVGGIDKARAALTALDRLSS